MPELLFARYVRQAAAMLACVDSCRATDSEWLCHEMTAVSRRIGETVSSIQSGKTENKAEEFVYTKRKRIKFMVSIETISADELDDYLDRKDAVIIDLRDRKAYKESHFKTAVNIPYEEIGTCNKIPRRKILILYCERGGSSLFAARTLMKKGYRVKSVVGGIRCYQGSNLYFSTEHSRMKET